MTGEKKKSSGLHNALYWATWLVLLSILYFLAHLIFGGGWEEVARKININKLMQYRVVFLLSLPPLILVFLASFLFCTGIALLLSDIRRVRIYGTVLILVSIILNIETSNSFVYYLIPAIIMATNLIYNKLINGHAYKGGWIPSLVAFLLMGMYVVVGRMILVRPQIGFGSFVREVHVITVIAFFIVPATILLVAVISQRTGMIPRYMRTPRALPRLPKRVKGVTLIELLIVVAIISIITPAILHSVRPAMAQTAKSRDARQATQLARNTIEQLRMGRLPLDPNTAFTQRDANGLNAQVNVGEPRPDGLLPVSIEIVIGLEWMEEPISFNTLLAPPEVQP